jgi:hypothetical protein
MAACERCVGCKVRFSGSLLEAESLTRRGHCVGCDDYLIEAECRHDPADWTVR